MCKLAIMTNLSKLTNPIEFSEYMADVLKDQRDGYGYAMLGENGVFGARTLTPDSFSNTEFPDFCQSSGNTKLFGKTGTKLKYGLFHGRISTNNVSLINTHPININDNYLIHNGVVTDHGKKYKKLTTNDSEDVLHNFLKGGIKQVSKNLTGYYASGIISNDGLLHVFRDAIAPLMYAYSKKLDSHIFATNDTIIQLIADYLGETLSSNKVKDNTYLCYNGNDLIKQESFKSRGYDNYSSKLSQKSLGFKIKTFGDSYSSSTIDLDDICDKFLEELEFMDESYTFHSEDWVNEMTIDQFFNLSLKEQAACNIIRSDKTQVQTLKSNLDYFKTSFNDESKWVY